jgi:ubiquinone/menaquinone biosynthesis C-methylase UbiE
MSTAAFVGSIPELYDRHMGPVLFEPYAQELAARLPADAARVLEIAAGTGRVTRRLLERPLRELVVTDLNEPMLAEAKRRIGDDPRVTWQPADAQQLPFADGSFDAIVCSFGLMFVPDKPRALAEMRRVLRPGGTLLLTTWDSLANNPASLVLHDEARAAFPSDPPAFMAIPFSLHDPVQLHGFAVGFSEAAVETLVRTGEAASAAHLATGFVRGNPLWHQLVERGIDAAALEARVAKSIAEKFGDHPCRSPISAHLLVARA